MTDPIVPDTKIHIKDRLAFIWMAFIRTKDYQAFMWMAFIRSKDYQAFIWMAFIRTKDYQKNTMRYDKQHPTTKKDKNSVWSHAWDKLWSRAY